MAMVVCASSRMAMRAQAMPSVRAMSNCSAREYCTGVVGSSMRTLRCTAALALIEMGSSSP